MLTMPWYFWIIIAAVIIAVAVACFALGIYYRKKIAEREITSAEEEAKRIINESIKSAESKKREALVEAKEEIHKSRSEYEREVKERRADLQKQERRLQQKEENLDRKIDSVEKKSDTLNNKIAAVEAQQQEVALVKKSQLEMLEKISGFSVEEAKTYLINNIRDDVTHEMAMKIKEIETQYKEEADEKAREIIATAIQRCAADHASEITVSVVPLPNDEMKGRIIGREGRNIRTLETLTGVDIIIDDTPEAVVISCFDPVRKEIARVALERLVQDGRIHPSRIEEMVGKVSKEVGRIIVDEGEKVIFDLGIHNMGPELIRALGRLYFRTSYGQNVLYHSKEVAILAGMIASEVGANAEIAMRGGLLHDIGKGAETESEANHAELGADLVKRLGEDPRVVNAVAAHHGDVDTNCIESIIVQIADAISAARPGARRESLDNYIKRLESLEGIAKSFEGVDSAYAVQAGRELRILVNNTTVSDEDAKDIAKGIAERIEAELRYPGKIKVTIIRETRIVEYAR